MSPKAIAVASGGLDSTTLIYDLIEKGVEVDVVSFDYGQRHHKELSYAEATADKLGLKWDLIDLSNLTTLLAPSGSALVSDTPVPEGHYAEDNMKVTVVPNRNMIMLSIAGGIAVARSADSIATAVHAGDHAIYPDCRPEFIDNVHWALESGNRGLAPQFTNGTTIIAPYINQTKAQIALRALELGVPLHETWSCYKGGDIHCGKCGTCVERLEAIDQAQKMYEEMHHELQAPVDETEYEDSEFWKTVTA